MKKVLLFVLLSLPALVWSQEKTGKELQYDEEFKLSALPYYNYGKGLGMTSADSLFQLNIRFRMQNRITYYDYEDDNQDSEYEAQIRRLRLRLDGYVGNPKFQYALQLSFSPGDVGGALKDGQNINIIRDATVGYSPNEKWAFIFGQTKLPGNRQRVNSSGALQMTDRSINNARFNIDRDFGVQAYYMNEFQDKFSWNIKTAISSGKGRNWSGKNNNVALTGKVELYPFGVFTKGGEYFEGDVKREATPKLMLSGVYHQNNKSMSSQGTLGTALYEPTTLKSMMFDAILKYNGWAGMVAYMQRDASNPITEGIDESGNYSQAMVYAGHGMDYQLSYIFPKDYEVIGRFSTQKMKDELFQANMPNQNQYSIGLTKYIWEHAFKIQTEFTLDKLKFQDGTTQNNWYVRFQIEIGI
ncbi:porin [Avrilella dinanensis]|uniref:Porin n=1 Tax=Avrilella dinanensis TaxID=2008672 RepID=A0A2M9R437_9FLAO|nr:porin [Avrilella dinanensis]PJR03483.1 porin [Avrilella dinanensis]